MAERSCDVAVVGGGIVGAATATALTQAGFATLLIEAGRRPPIFDRDGEHDPRVYALAPSSRRFLDGLGLWSAIEAGRVAPIAAMRVWERDPVRALRFDAAEAGSPALGWIVEQNLLADVLWSALPGSVGLPQVKVESARFEDEDVRLSLSDGSVVRAALAVGAEGARSSLREAAGIGTEGWSYASVALVCHMNCSVPHHGEALQRFLPTGPIAFLPLSDGRRSLVWSTTEAAARELAALPDETFAGRLEEAVQGAVGTIGPITRRLSFPLRLMHAERYAAPRFALVGDSAHVIHPLAGQGLNLGLADAEELVEELVRAKAARREWSSLRTLQRFERARADANLEMMALTDALHRAFQLKAPLLRGLFGRGLEWVDRVPAIKRGLMRRAQG